MEFLGGLLSGGASLLGGMMNNSNQQSLNRQNNEWQTMLQIQNQQWQTQMSNTAYQRGVADMKAAGLNPMMMFGSGGPSSTPSVGTSSVSPAQVRDPITPAVEAMIRAITGLKEAEQKSVQNENIAAQTAVQVASKAEVEARTANEVARNPYVPDREKAQIVRDQESARQSASQANLNADHGDLVRNQSAKTVSEKVGIDQQNDIRKNFGSDNLMSPSTWRPAIQGAGKVAGTLGMGAMHQTGKMLDVLGSSFKKYIDAAPTKFPAGLSPAAREAKKMEEYRASPGWQEYNR